MLVSEILLRGDALSEEMMEHLIRGLLGRVATLPGWSSFKQYRGQR